MKAFALSVALWCSGCALTSKAKPIENRYFSPERAQVAPAAVSVPEPVVRLRLGRLSASANLRYRIVHRESQVEVSPYETLRWTETPADYVERSLVRALFGCGRFQQVVSGPGLTLDVEVIAFEDAHRGRQRSGRVQLSYRLHDERIVIASGVVEVERDAPADSIDSVVAAIGTAMEGATAEIAERVARQLRSEEPTAKKSIGTSDPSP
jgi:ABC-type uncharacterized transport system auxiliary subunit